MTNQLQLDIKLDLVGSLLDKGQRMADKTAQTAADLVVADRDGAAGQIVSMLEAELGKVEIYRAHCESTRNDQGELYARAKARTITETINKTLEIIKAYA